MLSMKLFKRAISLLCVAALVLGLAACSGGDTNSASSTPTGDANKKPSSQDTTSWRPNPTVEEEEAPFVDTDGDFDYEEVEWAGPKGYVIVIPAGDNNARASAEYLQTYYTEVHDITLQIVTDAASATDKEILIGATRRAESNKDMDEADLEVSLQGNKLVFDGGHYVTVDSAVRKFVRKLPEPGKALTFKITTDFVSKATPEALDGDYYYVWGDEFEDADLNYRKWDFNMNMGGSPKNEISWENCCIDVSDGRLKIKAIRYFNPEREGTEFRSPYSTTHAWHMNFIYGYAEIRAKIPFEKGLWPSWWGVSGSANLPEKTDPGKYKQQVYNVEIDIYEVFGNESQVVPNIHKWYKGDYNYWIENGLEQGENNNHTQWNKERQVWDWYDHMDDIENLDNEYHVYGYEWTPTEVSMWVEGQKYMTFDITKSYDLNKDMKGFQDPIFFMFNMHVFADDAEYQPNLIKDNIEALPGEYCVDYYRVYQKKDGKSKIWIEDTPREVIYSGRDDPWTPEE